jgi:hypothetical protein
VDAQALNAAAFAGGMGPLIGYWCETGCVAADLETAERFAAALDHGRRRAARMRQALEGIITLLADRGIDAVVLNSAHTRHRYFVDPGTRTSADIDLLMRPSDRPAARGALHDLGYRKASPAARSRQSRWTLPDGSGPPRSLDFAHAHDPWSVHLHETLDRRAFGGKRSTLGTPDPSAGELWHEFTHPVRVLAQPLLLAHLALRTSCHFPAIMLVRFVELALVCRRDFADNPDAWRAFDDFVARRRTGRFMLPALDLTERLVPGSIDPEVREHVVAATSGRLRRLVGTTTPAAALHMHPLPG